MKVQEWQKAGLLKGGERQRKARGLSDLKKQRLGRCESTFHTSQQLLGEKEKGFILCSPEGQVEAKGECLTRDKEV